MLEFLKNTFAFNPGSPLLFTQFYFWVFFALVFAVFSRLQNKLLMRNTWLCVASLFFYYKTSGLFVLILLFTTFFNYYQAHLIYRTASNEWKKRNIVIGLIVNMFFLFFFKYAYFVTDVVNQIFDCNFHVFNAFAHFGNVLSGTERFEVSRILLPVGISFYTFQNISYLMDVYRKRIKPMAEILNFGLYVSFFPQLVAGPIIRAAEFVPQIYKPYYLTQKYFGLAVFWILNGLAKKIILSDYIAVNFVDRVFENPGMFSGFENLVALFAYSLQVYADFSGYTDIAIGVAMLMGFHLPQNFNSPYKASNASNFWKRWHISLSKWLQDYLYVPLGGNRNATFATYLVTILIALAAMMLASNAWVSLAILAILLRVLYMFYSKPEMRKTINTNLNLMNTMLIGGLWHGASWNFMIWGGLNGVGILAYKYWKDKSEWRKTVIQCSLLGACLLLEFLFDAPLFRIAVVWVSIVLFGTLIRYAYFVVDSKRKFSWLGNAWGIFQTFVYISFTRLFFRSGSNLDPAEANQTAWNTAQSMVNQIGSQWNMSLISSMIYEYRFVFSLFVIGMLIHWLPDNFKRRYRLSFARLPTVAIAIIVVMSVFIIYQFVTADLQSFIYFQF
ncbi:poly(beta-D-mannuronate) O-acetylase [Candidatus Symbiothrix dinenymphae]|nr:poly(beta-D-mannuronate) O-acetylase [Candidatus Symbiothrix dinenymphae]